MHFETKLNVSKTYDVYIKIYIIQLIKRNPNT